jgi:hypothetical protein
MTAGPADAQWLSPCLWAGDLHYRAVSDTGWDELLGLVRLLQDLGGQDAR